MSINVAKILSNVNSKSDIEVALESRMTRANQSNFISILANKPKSVVVENYGNILDTELGANFLNYHIHTESVTVPELECLMCEIDKRLPEDTKDSTLSKLKDMTCTCIENKKSSETIKEELMYRFAVNDFSSDCLYESMLVDDLDIVGYSINITPEAVSNYAAIIQKIEIEDYARVADSLPIILTKNTEMLLGLYVTFSGRTASLFTSCPTVIARRILKDGTAKQKIAYAKVLDRNISMVREGLKDCESKHYKLLSEYLKNLYLAKETLDNTMMSVRESFGLNEGIEDMQPDIVSSEDDKNVPVYDLTWKAREVTLDMLFDDGEVKLENLIKLGQFSAEADKVYGVTEGRLGKFVSKKAHSIEKASRKATSKIREKIDDGRRAKVAIQKAASPAINLINKTVNDIKGMDKKERRERIVTSEFKLKLKKVFKVAINIIVGVLVGKAAFGGGILAAVGGAVITVIGIIAGLIVDDALDAKVRRELIAELETELAVVNEKLDDAKSGDSKEAKYQLIRIKKKLEADLDRVKYRLPSSSVKQPTKD